MATSKEDHEVNSADNDTSEQVEPASHPSAVINMVNSTLGAGMLGIPLAYSKAGLLPAIILHILMGVMSYLSFYYITYGSEATGFYTYGELAHHLFGTIGTLIVEICTFTYTFGPMWSYCIMIGDFLPSVLRGVGVSADSLITNRVFVIIIIAAFIIQPLTWFRSLNALRFTSFFGMISMMFCVLVIMIRFFASGDNVTNKSDLETVHPSASMIQTFSTLCFAFGCQQNVPLIHGEIYEKSTKHMNIICLIAVFIVGVFYMLAGIFGYCTFTTLFKENSDTSGNVLTLYKDDDYLVFAARLASLVTVTFCCPINALPARVSLYNIVASIKEIYREKKQKQNANNDNPTSSNNAVELGTISQTDSIHDEDTGDHDEDTGDHDQSDTSATTQPPNSSRASDSPPPTSSTQDDSEQSVISQPYSSELSQSEEMGMSHGSVSQSPSSVSPILQQSDGSGSNESYTFAPHPDSAPQDSATEDDGWKQKKFLCLTYEVWLSTIVGTVMVILAVLLAIFLPNVSFVFDFLGSTAGVVVAFLFPAALFIRLLINPQTYAVLNRDPNTTRPEGLEDFHRRNEKIMIPQGWTSPWVISAIVVFILGIIFGLFSLALAIIFDTSLGDDIDW